MFHSANWLDYLSSVLSYSQIKGSSDESFAEGLRRRCFQRNESNNIPHSFVSAFERVEIGLISFDVNGFHSSVRS